LSVALFHLVQFNAPNRRTYSLLAHFAQLELFCYLLGFGYPNATLVFSALGFFNVTHSLYQLCTSETAQDDCAQSSAVTFCRCRPPAPKVKLQDQSLGYSGLF